MGEYEGLISDAPQKTSTYKYGGRNLTMQELYLCVMVEESMKQFGIDDAVAISTIILGRPLLQTRGKFRFATPKTSVASVICRYLFDFDMPMRLPAITGATLSTLRISWTTNLGSFIGRQVPYLGWTIAASDVIAINVKTIMHYNKLVRPEDQINDATTGSFG